LTYTLKSDTILENLKEHEQQKEIVDYDLSDLDRGVLRPVHATPRSLLRVGYAIR